MISRRSLIAAAAGGLAMPAVGKAAKSSLLRFVPQADLAVLDPIASYAYVTRNHAMMVFDTLYGIDIDNRPQPQMVAGHVVEDEGLRWTLTLREDLRFHDGTPVLGRDAVSSIRRWAKRDNVGQALWAVVDELSAPDDRTIRFRLKVPFSMLPAALGKIGTNVAAIMPERLAATDSALPLTEMVGSARCRGWRAPGSRRRS